MLTQQKKEIWRIQHFEGDTRLGVFGDYYSEKEALDAVEFFQMTDTQPRRFDYRIVHFTKTK